jgi:uncharacterized repeat protein (TIGR03803 family)
MKAVSSLAAQIIFLAVGWLALLEKGQGQVETILHNFGGNGDGVSPTADLIQGSDGNFYGTTATGGSSGQGTIFRMTPQGFYELLHNFGSTFPKDGTQPQGALIQGTDGNFYGTTEYGGSAGNGTVFKQSPSGPYTILHNFGDGSVPNDGANPTSALTEGFDGNFYGTTSATGGTVFKITPQGTETILCSFGPNLDEPFGANALTQGADGNFYGTIDTDSGDLDTTFSGLTNGGGVVFKVTPQGSFSVQDTFGLGPFLADHPFLYQ